MRRRGQVQCCSSRMFHGTSRSQSTRIGASGRWQRLADLLRDNGIAVYQTSYGQVRLFGVREIKISTFRQAAAAISGFPLVIVPEGGLHHAAAAVGTPAIVIFGGCIPPAVSGL